MFCKHEWSILSETTTKSKFEHVMQVASDSGTSSGSIPYQMCNADRKLIQIVSCSKCGKLKRFVTEV